MKELKEQASICGWCFPGLRSIDGREVTTGICAKHMEFSKVNALFSIAFEKTFDEFASVAPLDTQHLVSEMVNAHKQYREYLKEI